METPFWTGGPIPLSRLDAYALPRPAALQAILSALDTARYAQIGGPPGCGKSTLAHQVASRLGVRTIILSSASLPVGDEADHMHHLAQEVLPDSRQPPRAWEEFRPRLGARDLLVLDGLDAGELVWARQLADRLGLRIVVIAAEGITPDSLPDGMASLFLEKRAAAARCGWTASALRQAVTLAAGSPMVLQHVGQACIQAARDNGRSRIEGETFEEGAFRAASLPPARLLEGLAGLTGARMALVKAMALFPDESPTAWARRCGLEPKAVIVHLQRLGAAGLVERARRGAYRLHSPLLALHVRTRHGSLVHTFNVNAT